MSSLWLQFVRKSISHIDKILIMQMLFNIELNIVPAIEKAMQSWWEMK